MSALTVGLLGVAMFAVVILSQVAVLLLAKHLLVPSTTVGIEINDDPDSRISVAGGSTLLATMAAREVFIPSACGGKGTCGVCKVVVREGGGALLPTEKSHISAREAREGERLACQVKVKADMRIEIPPEIFSVRQWRCKVRSNDNVATFIKELVLELPAGDAVPFRAGGYVQVVCPPHVVRYKDFEIGAEYAGDWEKYELWRYVSTVREEVTRAYSMANYPGEEGIIMLNIRVASPPPDAVHAPPGMMSSWIFGLEPGDEVVISGPFGEFFARQTDNEMCFIAGGAGMAPMRSHIFDQFRRVRTDRKVTFWYGARSLREAFYSHEFDAIAREFPNFDWTLALSHPLEDDAWTGPTGWVHKVALERYLSQHPAPEDIEYYLCGPPLMVAAVQDMLADLGVEPENIMFDDFG